MISHISHIRHIRLNKKMGMYTEIYHTRYEILV